jgi:predicted secreted protein
MQIGSALAVYFIIWWLTLFAVLPFGIRSQQESGDVVAGSDPGAPSSARMTRVFVITTLAAAVLFAAFWLIYVMNIFELAVISDLRRR